MNLLAACTFCNVDLTKVDKELADKLRDDFCIDDEYDDVTVTEADLHTYDIPYDAVEPSSWEFDSDELREILLTRLGKHPHYLVVANGCRWNGTSGYKFCDDICDTVYRNYDVTIETQEEIEGRALKCRESSHDVPTGSTTIIVGISTEEYDKLEEAEFNEVIDFANKLF